MQCQWWVSVAVSPGPWVSRSVIPNRWWILTNRWQTAAPRDHWDLISELLSTQRGRRDTNIILASYKPSSCVVYCVVCGPYQIKKPPLYTFICGLPQLLSVSDSEWRKSDWLRDWQMALCVYKCNLMSHDSGAWWSQPAAGDLWPGSGRHKEV